MCENLVKHFCHIAIYFSQNSLLKYFCYTNGPMLGKCFFIYPINILIRVLESTIPEKLAEKLDTHATSSEKIIIQMIICLICFPANIFDLLLK